MKWLLIILLFIMVSCSKDELGPQYIDQGEASEGRRIYLINEGNFGWGNASLSVYHTKGKTVEHNVFEQTNGYSPGDVAQSMTQVDDKLYLVVNNSDKIEVLDTSELSVIHTISNLNSPRYIESVGDKVFVTSLYGSSITILSTIDHTQIGQIPVNGWSEYIISHQGFIYASLPDEGKLIKIDPVNQLIMDSLDLTVGTGKTVTDQMGYMWTLCSGGINQEIPALYKIDPNTFSVVDSIMFSNTDQSPGALCINAMADTLYYLNEHVFRLSVNDIVLPSQPFLDGTNKTFYTLFMDAASNELYVSDALDYIQQSEIYRISAGGSELDNFRGGVITGNFFAK